MSDTDNLFYIVMEADGDDASPVDATGSDMGTGGDAPAEDIAPPAADNAGDDAAGGDDMPPEMNDASMGMDDFGSDDGGTDTGDSDTSSDMGSGDGSEEDADKKDESLSEKANNILNEQLYSRLTKRNSDIEQIISSIKELVPLLPYDTVKSNDEAMSQLKTALARGKQYAINDFESSAYGENQLFFQKLNSLYTLLLNRIDANLKKIHKD